MHAYLERYLFIVFQTKNFNLPQFGGIIVLTFQLQMEYDNNGKSDYIFALRFINEKIPLVISSTYQVLIAHYSHK